MVVGDAWKREWSRNIPNMWLPNHAGQCHKPTMIQASRESKNGATPEEFKVANLGWRWEITNFYTRAARTNNNLCKTRHSLGIVHCRFTVEYQRITVAFLGIMFFRSVFFDVCFPASLLFCFYDVCFSAFPCFSAFVVLCFSASPCFASLITKKNKTENKNKTILDPNVNLGSFGEWKGTPKQPNKKYWINGIVDVFSKDTIVLLVHWYVGLPKNRAPISVHHHFPNDLLAVVGCSLFLEVLDQIQMMATSHFADVTINIYIYTYSKLYFPMVSIMRLILKVALTIY